MVRSTFREDFRAFMEDHVPEDRRVFDWHDAARDPEANYPVDWRVNGTLRPLLVYALANDDQVNVATISMHQFERWGLVSRSLGVFEAQEEINRKVLARFTDVCERQFSSLAGNRDRIAAFLDEAVKA